MVQFNRGFNMVCFLGLSAVDDFALFFLAHRDRLRNFRLSFVMSSGTTVCSMAWSAVGLFRLLCNSLGWLW